MDAERSGDAQKIKEVDDRLGFLTPILKGFLTGKSTAFLNVTHGHVSSM